MRLNQRKMEFRFVGWIIFVEGVQKCIYFILIHEHISDFSPIMQCEIDWHDFVGQKEWSHTSAIWKCLRLIFNFVRNWNICSFYRELRINSKSFVSPRSALNITGVRYTVTPQCGSVRVYQLWNMTIRQMHFVHSYRRQTHTREKWPPSDTPLRLSMLGMSCNAIKSSLVTAHRAHTPLPTNRSTYE